MIRKMLNNMSKMQQPLFTEVFGGHIFAIFTNLPTIMSSRSVDCGLIRVQMSMVNRVLLLLKMEAKEDMRAANITASMRPRKPAAERRQEGRWVEDGGQGEETSPLNWADQCLYHLA